MRLTRCWASGSIHSGSIFALTLAHSREVSTSSADMIQRGGFLKSAEPGKTANFALRAPRYSFFSVSFSPMCDSSPASSD